LIALLIVCASFAACRPTACAPQEPQNQPFPPPPPPPAGPANVTPVAGPVDYRLIEVPAGTFRMGSSLTEVGRDSDESPVHVVTISRLFLLGETEVTSGLWRQVMGAKPSLFAACGPDCPVVDVTWYDAVAFCNKMSENEGFSKCYSGDGPATTYDQNCTGFRLPTEAEWEYAARAGSLTSLPTGDLTDQHCGVDANLDQLGWYCGNAEVTYEGCRSAADGGGPECAGIHPAKEKKPNSFGFYDMNGNAFEWVWDWFGPFTEDAATDPTGPPTGELRVLRGGGWRSLAIHCRSANRRTNEPGYRMSIIGLRVARNAPAGKNSEE
jgi:formylglycine-generating enzyme required for sulfatase activity